MIYYAVQSIPWDYKECEPVYKEAVVKDLYGGNYALAAKDGYSRAFAEMSKMMEDCGLRWIGLALDNPLYVGALGSCDKAADLCPSWAKVEVFSQESFWEVYKEEDILFSLGRDFLSS